MFDKVIRVGAWLVLATMPVHAQSPQDIRAYIARYQKAALAQEEEFGIPASITLAQGILESGAGTSELTRHTNNHFGIKALGNWSGDVYLAWDDETAKSRFRCYTSAEESFRDHARILKESPRYASLFHTSVYDYRAWALGLQKAGYATSGNYARALVGFIEAYRLYALNGGIKLRPGKPVSVTSGTMPPEAGDETDSPKVSEEEEEIIRMVERYVVEINRLRCTILCAGTSLSQVSQKYDIPKRKLLEYNEVASESDLQEGNIIFLESKRKRYTGIQDYYRVKEGDTIYGISQQFGIRVGSLMKMNGKHLFSELVPGEKIRLK